MVWFHSMLLPFFRGWSLLQVGLSGVRKIGQWNYLGNDLDGRLGLPFFVSTGTRFKCSIVWLGAPNDCDYVIILSALCQLFSKWIVTKIDSRDEIEFHEGQRFKLLIEDYDSSTLA
jgi:hypothetical protein